MKIVVLFAIFLSAFAFADDPHHNRGSQGGDVSVTDNSVMSFGGDRSDIVTTILGDVDIGDCLYSWQVIIIQGVKANKFCQLMGLANDQQLLGNHHSAAMLKCKLKIVKDVWGTESECVKALQYKPPSNPKTEETTVPTSGPLIQEVMTAQIQEAQERQDLADRIARIEVGQQIASQKAEARREFAQQTMEKFEHDPEN